MNRFFITALAVISIMFAFVGCPQSEPENKSGSDNQQTTPPSAQPGTKISASSLADLQAKIEGSSDSVLDLSLCSNLGSGTLTINKAITLQNFTDTGASIVVTDANVTLSSFNVNSITTQNSGSSSLKIANSSLASLTLSGDGVARSDARAETKPKSLIFDTIVAGEVCFNESVELDIANVGLNIGSFTSNAEATINMTESAYEEYQSKYSSGNLNISANGNITDETMYAYLDEYGFAGNDFILKTKKFPSDCVGYISKLLKKHKKDAPNIPSLSLTSNDDYFQYYWNTWSSNDSILSTDSAVLFVTLPKNANFDQNAYETALRNAGFEDSPRGLAYTNEDEIDEMWEELEDMDIDESNYMSAYTEIINKISNMVIYNVEVDIEWSYENYDSDDKVYSIEYTYYAMKYGDLNGNMFHPYGN